MIARLVRMFRRPPQPDPELEEHRATQEQTVQRAEALREVLYRDVRHAEGVADDRRSRNKGHTPERRHGLS